MAIKTISSTTIHENHWQEYKEDQIELSNGEVITYCYLQKKHTGVAIIAQNDRKEIAVLNIYRHPLEYIWQLPLEHVEEGEEDIHGAVRGCKEELRLYPQTIEKVGEFYPDPGTTAQTAKVFIVTQLSELTEQNREEQWEKDTTKQIKWCSLDQIEQMIKSGEIKDGWTISAITIYKNYLTKNR